VTLISEGVSATGPFALLNPVNLLDSGEFKKVRDRCVRVRLTDRFPHG
jgi:hypothetical protein